MIELDHTHDPAAESWIPLPPVHAGDDPTAVDPADFPIRNLPFAVFRRRGTQEPWRGGVAIHDQVLDLGALWRTGLLDGLAGEACLHAAQPTLNALLSMGRPAWRALRHGLFALLSSQASGTTRQRVAACLVPHGAAEFTVPMRVGNYTDFYTSIHHARNIGQLRRADYQLPENFRWMPVAYHGRASTVQASGLGVRRPHGQMRADDSAGPPRFGLSRRLDYELEIGAVIGPGNRMGEPIPLDHAEEHVFGLCLLNDWSARDIQFWESTPLGPFLGKNFATTVGPWIVTLEALAPYRAAWEREAAEPEPLPYLDSPAVRRSGAFEIELQAHLRCGKATRQVSSTSFRHQYWTIAQMVAHHTCGGCSLEPGDLIGSGTISGPGATEAGALIELSRAGRSPIHVGPHQRAFVEDGDTVIFRARCGPAGAGIGFGASWGTVTAAAARS